MAFIHLFYNSPNKEDCCEICGEEKNVHIKEINISSNSNNISFVSINCNLNKKEDKLNIYKIKTKEKIKNKK